MIPLDVRLNNFIGAVAFAADEELQRTVWFDKKPSLTSITSIGEFFCQFFDDNDMDGFINDELASAPISQERKAAILDFRAALGPIEQLQSYRDEDDQKTAQTQEWKALVNCARLTLRRFTGAA